MRANVSDWWPGDLFRRSLDGRSLAESRFFRRDALRQKLLHALAHFRADGSLRERPEPIVERFVLGQRQQRAGQVAREWTLFEQALGIQQLADIDRRAMVALIVIATKPGDRQSIGLAIEQPRPEFNRAIQPRSVGTVGREIAERRIGHDRRNVFRRQIGDQRTLPKDFVLADSHGRIIESVAKQPARGNLIRGRGQLGRRRPWAVEQQIKVARPELSIASHRLAIQPNVVGRGAEQDVGHAILVARNLQFILVAVDAGPAMGAQERIANRPTKTFERRLSRSWFVQPTRLRHANSDRALVPFDRMQ